MEGAFFRERALFSLLVELVGSLILGSILEDGCFNVL